MVIGQALNIFVNLISVYAQKWLPSHGINLKSGSWLDWPLPTVADDTHFET